jgi:predicted RNA binding protein YcfA (HicA-like mRNA interferase family)
MGHIPGFSGQEVVQIFESFGWHLARQKGSHLIMVKQGQIATLSIPNHKQIAKGTIRSLVRSANLTMDQFVAAVK